LPNHKRILTLDGAVDAEIDVKTSIDGMISVIEQH
jgi:hypothetical protein